MVFPSVLATIAISLASLSEGLTFHAPYAQGSVDLDSPLRFLANSGPFNEAIGYGIPTDTPEQCTIDQAHLFMREGARFPQNGLVEEFTELLTRLQNTSIAEATGPLSFVKEYKPINFDANFATAESFAGAYAGSLEVYKLGAQLRARYNHLTNDSSFTPIFAAGEKKVYDTARIFGESFFFDGQAGDFEVYVFDEDDDEGANTLTSAYSCPNYDDDTYDDYLDNSTLNYMQVEADRLNRLSPGFNLTDDDVYYMGMYCAFELNAVGASKFCEALSKDYFVSYSYDIDLSYFYSYGPGYNMSYVAGGLYVNATATLLKQGPKVAGPFSFSFSHETILLNYITALGLYRDETTLPIDAVDFTRQFHSSQNIAMGSRVITERLACANETSGKDDIYVRIILNNKVTPLPDCASGPGFSCPLDDYLSIIEENTVNFASACNLNSTAPQDLTFYWDWPTANYLTNYTFV